MAVTLRIFRQLAELSTRYKPAGRSLMLGRQMFYCPAADTAHMREVYGRILERNGYGLGLDDLVEPSGFSERLFRQLGFGEMESLDRSDYEGATHVWDLNRPVPEDWHRRYAFIFDGGTLEHVFNMPQAMRNVWDMLEVGGRFVSATPFNGYPGHGFYQFGPELVWSYWKRAMGCEVHVCRAIEANGNYSRALPDPEALGRRPEASSWRKPLPATRVLMYYEVEKMGPDPLGDVAFQSDYVADWRAHEETA